jgi:hypothetical protein
VQERCFIAEAEERAECFWDVCKRHLPGKQGSGVSSGARLDNSSEIWTDQPTTTNRIRNTEYDHNLSALRDETALDKTT